MSQGNEVVHHGPIAQHIVKFYDRRHEDIVPWRDFAFTQYDMYYLVGLAVLIFIIRTTLSQYIFKPFGKKNNIIGKNLHRFVENSWFTVYYLFAVVAGITILWNSSWLWSLDKCYDEFPDDHMNETLPGLEFYYILGLAFYTQALFGLVFVDEKMKDFNEMFAHHICTILLISISKIGRAHRIGSLILLLHDSVDIFLYSAKATNELRLKTLADTLFGLFAVTFFLLRLVYFPYITYYTTFNDHIKYFPQKWYFIRKVGDVDKLFQVDSYGVCIGGYCISTWYFLICLLCTLICLHIYWFSIITRMAYTKLFLKKELEDPRHHEEQKKKNK
ncbi:ceramide synthase [Acrasis kona]|uniref:Ceramide synthase n=1 Tax=Acrasis kona TaxID=1008807 RepID=A0AAW2YYW2_9EUKA